MRQDLLLVPEPKRSGQRLLIAKHNRRVAFSVLWLASNAEEGRCFCDGLNHINTLLKSKCTAKDTGTLCFGSEKSSFIEQIKLDSFFDIEPDLRHTPLIINEFGCNANSETTSTPPEKRQHKLMLDVIKSSILKREDATRYRSACMRLSYLAQDRSDLAETAKHLTQRMSEPREFDFIPLKRAAPHLVGKPNAALRFRRQEHVGRITVFVDSDLNRR